MAAPNECPVMTISKNGLRVAKLARRAKTVVSRGVPKYAERKDQGLAPSVPHEA